MNNMSFNESVFRAVGFIPKGRVATYGQVATMAGYDAGAARAVGNAIHTNRDSMKVPCHRVVCADGRMGSGYAMGGPAVQRQMLESEGVVFIDDKADLAHCGIVIEQHPLAPFLPADSKVLFLGSFPPPRTRWSMDFFYPNWINDFWRIQGLIHFNDQHFFEAEGEKRFDKQRIIEFCKAKGMAFYDTARKVCRLKGNASDEFLHILESSDIPYMMKQMPLCRTIVTTGGKSSEEFLNIIMKLEDQGEAYTDGITTIPAPCTCAGIVINGIKTDWWRMPSTSRAYPMPLLRKAAAYQMLSEKLNDF